MICLGVLLLIASMPLFMMTKWSLDALFAKSTIVWHVGCHFIKARRVRNSK